jgi:tetratricopeptide (TPR) repeat protein
MKKIILGLITLSIFGTAYGQKINYQKTFEDALTKAKAEHKLVFVTIAPTPPKTFEIQGRKVTYKSGIDETEAINFYNTNFVNYKASITDSASAPFRTKYQITFFPTYLFIDSRDNLVYSENSNSILAAKYITMGNNALAKLASGKTISAYEDRYRLGERLADFLKEYITLRQDLGLFDNAALADDYVDQLTIKSFQNYAEVLFVLKAGPYAYGKAYNLCYTNRKITDSIYKYEPLAVRTTINSRIIANTTNEAIKRKNAGMAQQAASFMSSSWSKQNPRQGYMASQSQMLYYYRSIKDTAAYYRQAGFFYDTYYMSISADSAKKLDTKRTENIQKMLLARYPTDTVRTVVKGPDSVKKIITRITHIGTPIQVSGNGTVSNSVSSGTAMSLNNAAYEFYELGTHNQNYLTKALLWSKRAIELNPTAAYYDTEAHLLYRLGFFDEARSAQSKAIELAQNETQTTIDGYKTELDKIKRRTL